MISIENKQISELFAKLRSLGALVYNFNQSHSLRSGVAKLCDFIIITPHSVNFIEVKLTSTKDRMTKAQETLMDKLESITSNGKTGVNYWEVIDRETAEAIYSYIQKELI